MYVCNYSICSLVMTKSHIALLNGLHNKKMYILLFNFHRWAVAHREQLEHHNSDLEFKLRRRKYLSLLSSGNVGEAVAYAKVFGQFSSRYVKGMYALCIQKLYNSINTVIKSG